MQPSSTIEDPEATTNAKMALQLLERQIPLLTSETHDEIEESVKIGFYTRDVLENWLERSTTQTCLWILDDEAGPLGRVVASACKDESLPVIYYRCERVDADDRILEPEQILYRLSCSTLHQLLCHIINRNLPMPERIELESYQELGDDSGSSTVLMALASNLIVNSSHLIWVIDGFDRLEDDDLPHTQAHQRGLDRLIALIGGSRDPTNESRNERCLIATASQSTGLTKLSMDEKIEKFVPRERADPKRYDLMDEIRSLITRAKQ